MKVFSVCLGCRWCDNPDCPESAKRLSEYRMDCVSFMPSDEGFETLKQTIKRGED